jgi:N-carbamoylputrescine amidase
MMEARQLRVAAVQLDCKPGQLQDNLEHAAYYIEIAASRSAQLILLPELMPSGYLLTEEIWNCAEPINGYSVSWLSKLAKGLKIYLGTSFLEVEGEDFFNTFVLIEPGGEICGRVRKSPPASVEAYFYRAGNDAHVLDTPVGRIGIGICYENLLIERLVDLFHASVDLVLQPTAAGRPRPFIPGDIGRFDRMVTQIAPQYARILGVPVVLANRTGSIHTEMPDGMPEFNSTFPGLSMIVDSGGLILGKLDEKEGILVEQVHLHPSHKNRKVPRPHGKMWALPVPWYAFIWPRSQKRGEQIYQQNERRKAQATKMSRPIPSNFSLGG